VLRSLLLYISKILFIVPKYPMRKHLTPRCSYFLVSLRVSVTVPLISSFLWKTGNFIFYLGVRILWYFWLGCRSNFISI
jgi:hypothetical protein